MLQAIIVRSLSNFGPLMYSYTSECITCVLIKENIVLKINNRVTASLRYRFTWFRSGCWCPFILFVFFVYFFSTFFCRIGVPEFTNVAMFTWTNVMHTARRFQAKVTYGSCFIVFRWAVTLTCFAYTFRIFYLITRVEIISKRIIWDWHSICLCTFMAGSEGGAMVIFCALNPTKSIAILTDDFRGILQQVSIWFLANCIARSFKNIFLFSELFVFQAGWQNSNKRKAASAATSSML